MKKIFNKTINWNRTLYIIYLFLYVFLMVNREFLLFGIDLRFILLPIGLFLILLELYNRKYNKRDNENYFDKDFKLLFLFFIWVFISNISWLWNGIGEINKTKFINEIILIANNFIGIIVFFLYKKYFKKELLNNIVIFSCLVLVLSFILLGLGFEMTEISGSNEMSIYASTEGAPDHINIFGGRI